MDNLFHIIGGTIFSIIFIMIGVLVIYSSMTSTFIRWDLFIFGGLFGSSGLLCLMIVFNDLLKKFLFYKLLNFVLLLIILLFFSLLFIWIGIFSDGNRFSNGSAIVGRTGIIVNELFESSITEDIKARLLFAGVGISMLALTIYIVFNKIR